MQSSPFPIVIVALLIAVALYWAIARLFRKAAPQGGTVEALQSENSRLLTELSTERNRNLALIAENGRLSGLSSSLQGELRTKVDECNNLSDDLTQHRTKLADATTSTKVSEATLAERLADLAAARNANSILEQELEKTRRRCEELNQQSLEANTHLTHLTKANSDMRTFLDDAQSRLAAAFSELATNAMAAKSKEIQGILDSSQTRARGDIDLLLKPFADRLGEFRTRIDDLYGKESQERASLLGAVNELKTLNQDMAAVTSAMTRALKGSSKVRGDWGEMMLENVLRGSGLEEGNHYKRQAKGSDDEGNRLHPDVVVQLPDNRWVVIDAKVNLVAWEEAMNAQTPEGQDEAMRRHAVALKQHMRELADKNYPKSLGENSLEITIAFVPIEGALSAALGHDGQLQAEAFERRVVFASPNTLMAMLRVVERLWTRDKVQRRAMEISDAGGLVIDALTKFLQDFELVGKRVKDASDAFVNARRTLSESSQAVIPRARRLVELGSRGRKKPHEELEVTDAMQNGLHTPPDDLIVLASPSPEVQQA